MDWQNSIGVLAVPFFTLGNIELEAVRAVEIPRWAGHRNSQFLIGCPNVPVRPWRFDVEPGQVCVKRGLLRRWIKRPTFPTVLAPDCEGDGPRRRIKQI